MKDKPIQMHTLEGKKEQSDGKSRSEKHAQTVLTLEKLVAGITEQNRHSEIDFGPAVGNEMW